MLIAEATKPFTLTELLDVERRVRRRNLREWIACGVVVSTFAWIAARTHGSLRFLSAVEVVAAAAYIAFRLHRDGRPAFAEAERAATPSGRAALARELRRQASLLSRAAEWYVAPLAIGWLGWQIAEALERGITAFYAANLAGGLVVGSVVVALNRRAAGRMALRAAELESAGIDA